MEYIKTLTKPLINGFLCLIGRNNVRYIKTSYCSETFNDYIEMDSYSVITSNNFKSHEEPILTDIKQEITIPVIHTHTVKLCEEYIKQEKSIPTSNTYFMTIYTNYYQKVFNIANTISYINKSSIGRTDPKTFISLYKGIIT